MTTIIAESKTPVTVIIEPAIVDSRERAPSALLVNSQLSDPLGSSSSHRSALCSRMLVNTDAPASRLGMNQKE